MSLTVSVSHWYWGTQHLTCASPLLSREEGSPPSVCCQQSSYWSLGDRWPSLSRQCIADMFTLLATRTSLPNSFLAGQLPACLGTWDYFSPGAGLCISLSETSENSCLPIPQAYWGPSEWQYPHLVCQSLLPDWYHLQMWEECTFISPSRSLIKLLSSSGASIYPENTTSDWCPARLCAADHNPLSSAV